MPDRDDAPDPMDDAYLRAEAALDDEAARTARRARLLAAVAQEPAPPAPTSSARSPIRRYGGWLAAACVAGLSVITAEQVYRLSAQRQQGAPSAPTTPPLAISATQRPANPAVAASAPAAPPTAATRRSAPSRTRSAKPAPPLVMPRPPIAPALDVAPPPPLPIPPVEKPIPPPVASLSAAVPAPVPPPGPNIQSVVVSGARIARRDYAVSAPMNSAVLQSKMLAEAARLRYDAAAGRTADIEALLAQGVPVDTADENGESALMKSIETGQREAAALLRRHGASLDLKTRAGVSARDMAAGKHDPELDKALGITPSAAAPP